MDAATAQDRLATMTTRYLDRYVCVCVLCAVPMCACNKIFLKIEDACGLGPDLELPPELTRVIDIMIITRNRRARAFQLLEYQMGGGRLYLTN